MNYYFFPQIPFLKTTVTLSNFPPTETPSWESQSVYLHATFSTGTKWRIFFIKELNSGEVISLVDKDLAQKGIQENSVFFFMYPERLHGNLEELPINKFIESEPSWRGNIKLSSNTTSVSYQGEYPGYMLNISNGTLLTFNPLIQTHPEVSTQLIVVSILRSPEIKEGLLFVINLVSGQVKKQFKIATNKFNLIDLSNMENDSRDPLCLFSPDMVGIPIFLSHDSSFRFLSLEHSYPLQEIIVFGEKAKRFDFLKEVKKYWIDSLSKNVSR